MKRSLWFLMWCVLRVYAFTRPKAVIKLDGEPYITRWFLTSRPDLGETGPPGWYLQRIHRPDADRRMHNHPWRWASSRILRGGYVEAREVRRLAFDTSSYHTLRHKPGSRVVLYSHASVNDYHRIQHVEPNTWTLFHAGPKHGEGWGFK